MSRIQSLFNMNNNVIDISIFGEFNFTLASELRKIYETEETVKKFNIDMSQITSMDSSAIGILIVMIEDITKQKPMARVHLTQFNAEIKELFDCIHIEQISSALTIDQQHYKSDD